MTKRDARPGDFPDGERQPCPHCGGVLVIVPKPDGTGHGVAHEEPSCEAFALAVEMTQRHEN